MAVFRVQLVSVSCNKMLCRQLPRNWSVSVSQVKVRRPLLCSNPNPLSVLAARVRLNSSKWQARRWIRFWAHSKECSRAQAVHQLHKDVNHLKRLLLVNHSKCNINKSLSNNPNQRHPNRTPCYNNCKPCWLSRALGCSLNPRLCHQKSSKGQWAQWKTIAFLKIGCNCFCPSSKKILRVLERLPLRINEFLVANRIMTRNN